MKSQVENESELRRYLLGDSSEAERLQIEERLFLESDYFQLFKSVEDDLIDRYLYDEIPPDERRKFEQHFLSDEARRTDVRIAKALKRYIAANALTEDRAAPEEDEILEAAKPVKSEPAFFDLFRRSPVAKLSLAAAALALIIGGGWIAFKFIRQQPQSSTAHNQQPEKGGGGEQKNDTRVEGEEARGDGQDTKNSAGEPGQSQPANRPDRQEVADKGKGAGTKERVDKLPPSSSTYVALLMPGSGSRGDGNSNQFRVPTNARLVNLQLPLIGESSYRGYRATLLTEDGKTINTGSRLNIETTKSGRVISLLVPTKLLRPQSYQVRLAGVRNDGSARDVSTYFFQILK